MCSRRVDIRESRGIPQGNDGSGGSVGVFLPFEIYFSFLAKLWYEREGSYGETVLAGVRSTHVGTETTEFILGRTGGIGPLEQARNCLALPTGVYSTVDK